MNQIVVKQFGSVDAAGNYAAALLRIQQTVGISGDGKDILRLDADGNGWVFGQDNTAVDRSDLWAVNPIGWRHGWIAFEERNLAVTLDGDPAEIVTDIRNPLEDYDDLPELDMPKKTSRRAGSNNRGPEWRVQIICDMVCVEGKNEGAEVVYKPTSTGGLRMQRKLSEEIARRIMDGNEKIVPIIELYDSEYRNKAYNKQIFNPEFEIIEWVSLNDAKFSSGAQPHPKEDERTAKGDKVDQRKTAKPNERRAARDEETEDENAGRSRRDRKGAEVVDLKARRVRDEEPEDDQQEDDAPRSRRARDEDAAPRTRARGERPSRTRDAPADDAAPRRARRDVEDEEQPEEDDAPRSRRSRNEPEDEPRGGPRGRNAARGGRRSR